MLWEKFPLQFSAGITSGQGLGILVEKCLLQKINKGILANKNYKNLDKNGLANTVWRDFRRITRPTH